MKMAKISMKTLPIAALYLSLLSFTPAMAEASAYQELLCADSDAVLTPQQEALLDNPFIEVDFEATFAKLPADQQVAYKYYEAQVDKLMPESDILTRADEDAFLDAEDDLMRLEDQLFETMCQAGVKIEFINWLDHMTPENRQKAEFIWGDIQKTSKNLEKKFDVLDNLIEETMSHSES